MHCRFDGLPLTKIVLDLGVMPLANALIETTDQGADEVFPLQVYFSERTGLLQTGTELDPSRIFASSYPFFSSVSSTWVEHTRRFCSMIIQRLGLSHRSRVYEIGSNDGSLLEQLQSAGIACTGIDPSSTVAEAAARRGTSVRCAYFDLELARELAVTEGLADLIVANNVLAHIPDIRSAVQGIAHLLAPHGTATIEVPYAVGLVRNRQIDSVYHEHFFYFTLTALSRVLESAALQITDVERLATHGGSLRIYVRHERSATVPSDAVAAMCDQERSLGAVSGTLYAELNSGARQLKSDLRVFLLEQRDHHRVVVAYPASAKGATLLNFCEIGTDLVQMVGDAAPSKQGRLMPGSRIPIVSPETLVRTKPDVLVVLSTNIVEEITDTLVPLREFGTRMVVPIPHLQVREWGAK